MPAALTDLLGGVTTAQATATLLQLLTAAGFPTTAWQTGTVGATFTQGEAPILSDLAGLVASIAAASVPSLTTPDAWMDTHANGFYNLTRKPSVVAQGPIVFTLPAGVAGGPYTIALGTAVQDAAGHAFTTTASGVLLASSPTVASTLTLNVAAVAPGSAYNAAPGTITTLVQSLPGVLVSNPDNGQGQAAWSTTAGADPETSASLLTRCQGQWSLLGVANTQSYQALCLGAASEITRVVVTTPSPGVVSILLAGAAGAVSSTAVTLATAAIVPYTPTGLSVGPPVSATPIVPTILGTALCAAAVAPQALAVAAQNLIALVATIPIGGTLYVAQALDAIMRADPSMRNVTGLAITAVGGTFDIQGNLTLTPTQVLNPPVVQLSPATY